MKIGCPNLGDGRRQERGLRELSRNGGKLMCIVGDMQRFPKIRTGRSSGGDEDAGYGMASVEDRLTDRGF